MRKWEPCRRYRSVYVALQSYLFPQRGEVFTLETLMQ